MYLSADQGKDSYAKGKDGENDAGYGKTKSG
jgi:hypothetical protein